LTRLSHEDPDEPKARRGLLDREPVIIFVFLFLAVLMTWPWVLHLRDAISDPGDPYLISWIMWWDFYQTFHDPLNLFQAPIFYPYSYSLAFSEHSYGLALPFFPLFALGATPLMVLGIATITGFAFSGYGAFRLARTLTGSNGAAWVAGIVFAFIPYRFHQLSHTQYLFAGWIPLLLEALVLFARERSWKRAIWLGVAFTMNALTCIHWFVLTMIPMGVSGVFLVTRYRIWMDRNLWLRGGLCLAVGTLALLPFFLPYQKVSQIYQMTRSRAEAASYSADLGNWLSADKLNKIWDGFGPSGGPGERALFPGLFPLLLLLAAIFLARSGVTNHHQPAHHDHVDADPPRARGPSRILLLLDATVIGSLVVATLAYGYRGTGIRLLGINRLLITDADKVLLFGAVVFFVRIVIAYPRVMRFRGDHCLIETLRAKRRSDVFGVGLIWLVLGFFGSLGINFFFHRFLFENVFLFRSLRTPARWAMIAYVGLALLAGLGAKQLAERIARRRPKFRAAFTFAIICVVLLFEQRAAPLPLMRGEPNPDEVTVYLRDTAMRGGIVHLPAGGKTGNYRYVLRQADHRRPLVTAISGFGTPILTEVETLSQGDPIPDRFLDLLEEIPASYLVVHDSLFEPRARAAVSDLLQRGSAGGRLRYIKRFAGSGINGNEGADLYAVSQVEPGAISLSAPPEAQPLPGLTALLDDDPTVLVRQFDDWSFALERWYLIAYGRLPKYEEFMTDARALAQGVTVDESGWRDKLGENFKSFAETWVKRPEFAKRYAGKSDEDFVAELFRNAGVTPADAERAKLVSGLRENTDTRAIVLRKVVSNESVARAERDRALVLIHYFGYLRRNPDDSPDNNLNGFNFWLTEFRKTGDAEQLRRAFTLTGEYEAILEKKK